MKKLFTILIFIIPFCVFSQTVTPSLIINGVASNNCTKVGDPKVDDCFTGVQRQIARSVNAEGLVSWIDPGPCWGLNPLPPNTSEVNCMPPYDKCWGNYCPNKYSQVIKGFVDLKASMILRAANIWGKSGSMKSGTNYYNAMQQFVIDVNAAYDCAGLRRPVIQGTIFENVDSGVNSVPISAEVINAFKNDMDFDINYYLNSNGSPKAINFLRNRINFNSGPLIDCPDITKIETRMWFYHCAKIFIDLGYKSIHMGQMVMWASNDNLFVKSKSTIDKIRQYAVSKNTFILLTEENYKALKYPNTNNFVFDFDTRVLWPTEIPSAGSSISCSKPLNNYLQNTICELENYLAVVDECVINNTGNTGGLSPLGCNYVFMPYNTYFDFGAGNHEPLGVATSNPVQSVWGWDDTKWFSEKISLDCRAVWLSETIKTLRQFHNGFGFMTAPTVLGIPKPENYDNYLNNMTPTASGTYLLIDEPTVFNKVLDKWTPNDNITINISKSCTSTSLYDQCYFRVMSKQNQYIFSINNPDLSTVYTWHIQNPDGSWQPYTYGTQRKFLPNKTGNYVVYVRQDNLGMFNSSSSEVKTDAYTLYLYRACCPKDGRLLRTYPSDLEDDYEGQIYSFSKKEDDMYDYNIYISQGQYYIEDTTNISYSRNSIDENETNNIIVFPNPVSKNLYIDYKGLGDENGYQLSVFNSKGQLVKSFNTLYIDSPNWSIDVSTFDTGVYYLLLYSNSSDKCIKAKFIKE